MGGLCVMIRGVVKSHDLATKTTTKIILASHFKVTSSKLCMGTDQRLFHGEGMMWRMGDFAKMYFLVPKVF